MSFQFGNEWTLISGLVTYPTCRDLFWKLRIRKVFLFEAMSDEPPALC